MAAESVDRLVAEVEAATARQLPRLAGLQDLARLELKPETAIAVQQLTQRISRRLTLHNRALEVLAALLDDGYPGESPLSVDPAIISDIEQQIGEIAAAYSQFVAEAEAVGGTITFTAIE